MVYNVFPIYIFICPEVEKTINGDLREFNSKMFMNIFFKCDYIAFNSMKVHGITEYVLKQLRLTFKHDMTSYSIGIF